MKVTVNVFALSVQTPNDGERVMVWDGYHKEWAPQVYNDHYKCWDSSDGDDYDRDATPDDIWFSLPDNPKFL